MPILRRRRKKSDIDRRQSLAGIPVLHEAVNVHDLNANRVELTFKLARGNGFLDRFRPPVLHKRYELDELGTFVVRQIDNKRSVLDIVREFEGRFKLSHREAELGVVAFIKMLMKRNVLSVAVK